MLTTLLLVAAIGGLLTLGKDSPLRLAFGALQSIAASRSRAAAIAPGDTIGSAIDETAPRLPEWITEPNDLQLMLLHLAHHAMLRGDIELKNQTIKLMRPFADLHLQPRSEHATNETEVAE